MTILPFVAAVILSLALSLIANRAMIAWAGKLGLMDLPGARRVHAAPVPRAGGLAVWSAFLATAFAASTIWPELLGSARADWLVPLATSSLVLVVVGVLDDRGGVRPLWKLAAQTAAAALFFFLRPDSHGKIMGLEAPMWLDAVIFIGWTVALINAFNLIDGLDGLCAGLGLIALVALGTMTAIQGHTGAMVLMFLMAAALLGFIRYNRNPARIFLGDTGSMLLGLFIASAATQSIGRRAVVGSLLLPIAVAGVPLLDVMLAVWRRAIRKLLHQWMGKERIGIFDPDKDHLHHRFLAAGNGQRKVARILHGLAVVLALLAFLPMIFGDHVIGVSVVGLMILSLFGLRSVARIELVQSGSMLHLAIKRPVGNRRLRLAVFFYDCAVVVLSAVGATWLLSHDFRTGRDVLPAMHFVAVFSVLGVASLFFAKAYRRVWSRASIRDVAGVCICLGGAGILSTTLVTLFREDLAFVTAGIAALASMAAMVGVSIPRCGAELVRELAVDAGHRRFDKRSDSERHVVIYGGGDLGNLFLDYLKTCPPSHFRSFRVVGFIDGNPMLKGRILRGFPVLGDLGELDKLALSHPLHGVIVAISHPDEERMEQLRGIAGRRRLNLYSWSFDLTPGLMEANARPESRRGTFSEVERGEGRLEPAG